MKFAYVTLLYGNSNYFLGALLLGYSIKKTGTKHDIVIMVTDDVPKEQIYVLSKYYNIIKKIDIIKSHEDYIKKSRFVDVFTKLHVFKLTEYKKVIMLDIDMLVINNMDKLFNLKAPAAYVPSLRKYKHGQPIKKNKFVKNKRLIRRINAGLMLLEPNMEHYNFFLSDVKKKKNINLNHEQDYLTYFYADKWTYIHLLYNYLVNYPIVHLSHKYKTKNIHNLHYGSKRKPWNFVKNGKLNKIKYEQFKKDKILQDVERTIDHYNLWFHMYEHVYKKWKNKFKINLDDIFESKNIWTSEKYYQT